MDSQMLTLMLDGSLCKLPLMTMEKEIFYSEQGYATLQRGVDFRDVGLDLIRFNGTEADLVREGKNHGAQKASKAYLQAHFPAYAEFLCSSEIVARCEDVVREKLYPFKLMHVISDSQTQAMPWHRDSYIHRGTQVGSNPARLVFCMAVSGAKSTTGILIT